MFSDDDSSGVAHAPQPPRRLSFNQKELVLIHMQGVRAQNPTLSLNKLCKACDERTAEITGSQSQSPTKQVWTSLLKDLDRALHQCGQDNLCLKDPDTNTLRKETPNYDAIHDAVTGELNPLAADQSRCLGLFVRLLEALAKRERPLSSSKKKTDARKEGQARRRETIDAAFEEGNMQLKGV